MPIYEQTLNRVTQQGHGDLILKKKLLLYPMWLTGEIIKRIFASISLRGILELSCSNYCCRNLLYCCGTPGFLGGSGSRWGSQTADSFSLKSEKDENQLLQRLAVTNSASDLTLHRAYYDINHFYSNNFCRISH